MRKALISFIAPPKQFLPDRFIKTQAFWLNEGDAETRFPYHDFYIRVDVYKPGIQRK